VATACSTFTALAPLNNVVTCTIGGVISGYLEMGILLNVINPMMTMRMEITIATIGLRIKNSLIKYAEG
jgi:hypothetical protein